jgi:hypothetical protein
MDQNQTGQQLQPEKPRNKKLIAVFSVVVMVVVLAVGGWAWHEQTKKHEASLQARDSRIDTLEDRLNTLKSSSEQSKNSQDQSADHVAKDAAGIHKALLAACNKGSATQMKYLIGDEQGNSVDTVTPAILALKDMDGNMRYAKGFAALGIGCRSAEATGEEGGGYVSILKQQSDGTWRELFGTQGILLCTLINEHKIPKEIIPLCDVGGVLQKNTN